MKEIYRNILGLTLIIIIIAAVIGAIIGFLILVSWIYKENIRGAEQRRQEIYQEYFKCLNEIQNQEWCYKQIVEEKL